jgi:hypothetical protein
MRLLVRIFQIAFAGMFAVLLAVVLMYCFWCYAPRGVLPSRYQTVRMSPAELEALVLKITPIGTHRKDLEKILNETFRCEWNQPAVSEGNISANYGFRVQISSGDEMIVSEFATYGLPLADVATVRFLLDADGNLKDVKAVIWGDAL